MDTPSPTIDDFLAAAWNDHATDPQGVLVGLHEGLALIETSPDHAAAFAHLVEHVVVAHLADADAMPPWHAALAPFEAGQPALTAALARAAVSTQLLRGEPVVAAGVSLTNQVRAHGTAALGRLVRGDVAGARALLASAAALAEDRAADDTDTLKALAANYHNIASQLHELRRESRDDTRDSLMMDAAHGSREVWSRAGTWMNVERADYMLSLCAAALGDGPQAMRHAQSCLSICEANGADAFERFFAHEAWGAACAVAGDTAGATQQLAALNELLPQIDEGDRAYCRGCIDKLAGTLG
jgi:hypothetical protein